MNNVVKAVEIEFEKIDDAINEIKDLEHEMNTIDYWIEVKQSYIDGADAMLKRLEREIASLKQDKITTIETIKKREKEIDDIYESWNGTVIKDADDEYEVPKRHYVTKRSKKVQMPCNNHTYKDMRRIRKDLRKTEKDLVQRSIVKMYSGSFRSGYREEFLIK